MNPKEWLEAHWLLKPKEYARWVDVKQDPFLQGTMRIVGIAVFVLTALVDVLYLIMGRQNLWMSAACLVCLGIYPALAVFLPAYFTMTQVDFGLTNRLGQVRLAVPLLCHMGMMGVFTYRDFHFVDAGMPVAVLLTVVLCGALLLAVCRECRVDDGRFWAVCLVLLIFGYGIVGQVNFVADRSDARPYGTELVEVEDIGRSGRKSDFLMGAVRESIGYQCTVTLADGSEASVNFPYYDSQSDSFYVGKKVVVYYYDGGLGLEYVCINGFVPYSPGKR